jgi:DNA-binding NarL/FixJ family response regulator
MASRPKQSPPASPKKSVFVVDDHPMFREAVAGRVGQDPGFEIMGQAGTATKAIEALRKSPCDIAIVDISLAGFDGIELIKHLRGEHPDLKILVLSMHDENIYAMRALRAGAKGFVMKSEPDDTVMKALRTIAQGETYVSNELAKKLLHRALHAGDPAMADPLSSLSDREIEVFRLIGDGQSTRAIAAKLNLSVKTIESHRSGIKEKLGLNTGAELLRYALDFMRQG